MLALLYIYWVMRWSSRKEEELLVGAKWIRRVSCQQHSCCHPQAFPLTGARTRGTEEAKDMASHASKEVSVCMDVYVVSMYVYAVSRYVYAVCMYVLSGTTALCIRA